MEREAGLVTGTQRVFFAFWPDDAVRNALAGTARKMHRVLHGRRTRDESIHLTLAFLGEVDIDEFGRLKALPGTLLTEAFTVTIDRWDCWPRNGIGWAGPGATPEPMRRLAENLGAWLRSEGFQQERRPFTPHITLIRNAQYAAMPEPLSPIEWPVKELVLVRSQLLPRGAQHEIVMRWELP